MSIDGQSGRPIDEQLGRLRELLSEARSVPMSASCVVNRSELLAIVDQVRATLPEELHRARGVLADAGAHRDQGRVQAEQIIAEARHRADGLVAETEIAVRARDEAERIRRDAYAESEALRKETDAFIDARMAAFESVLQKTTSQVRTARQKLSERSGLDEDVRENA